MVSGFIDGFVPQMWNEMSRERDPPCSLPGSVGKSIIKKELLNLTHGLQTVSSSL